MHHECSGVRPGGTVAEAASWGGIEPCYPWWAHVHGSPLVSNSSITLWSQVSCHTCATSALLLWAA